MTAGPRRASEISQRGPRLGPIGVEAFDFVRSTINRPFERAAAEFVAGPAAINLADLYRQLGRDGDGETVFARRTRLASRSLG